MTFKNAISLFNRLVSETTRKSEIKIYQDFIYLLEGLKERNLAEAEVQLIETELDTLDLKGTAKNKKRHYSKALRYFKQYLKDTFSLIAKGYYTNWGITLGALTGLLTGIVFFIGLERSLGISLGISIGTLIGLITASYLDTQAKASGNLI
ncbi:MAG: hypothetical protein RIC19_21985 [Phaeodactylibacter sp.]|uniref:hypothetical protein n=1 Tax=Phaeodactylibacter sp. TaxID=1940289 RepID=UPI0032EFAAF1